MLQSSILVDLWAIKMNLVDNKLMKYLFLFGIFIFVIGMSCVVNVPDNDLWARLIAGGYIVENLSVAKFDFLSYTPTHPWYDHEWGASIFFYLALKYFGHSGLIFLKGVLVALTLFFCYKTVEQRKPEATVPYNILYFAIMFLALNKTLGHTVRCLLFTCLFFAIFMYILERARQNKNKGLVLLPILMVLWSNIHGGCVSGLGLIGFYLVGEFLNKKPFMKYFYTLIASVLGLFINPYGIEYVQFLFSAVTMHREYISEWTSPFHPKYLMAYMQAKLYLFAMFIVVIAWHIKNKVKFAQMDKVKAIIFIAMTYLAVTHIRHLSFYILAVGTLFYNEFYSLFNSIIQKIKSLFKMDEDTAKSFVLFKEICVYLLIFILALPPLLDENKQIRITESEYPRYAIEFIDINKLNGNLFVNFDWGSYAAYKLYPNNLIVMDGRYEEVYDPELLLQLKDFHLVKNDWYKIIRDYKTDVLLLEKEYPVYNEILKHKDWTLVFENNLSGVFVPTSTVKEEYLMPIPADDFYNKTLFNTKIKYKELKSGN